MDQPGYLSEEDEDDEPKTLGQKVQALIKVGLSQLNFYRTHMIIFVLVPFALSGIFYACNGEFHIPYIDCLFMCVTSMTVTGLATVNLSTLTGFQQAMLFFQMMIGNITFVGLVMIYVRQHFFRQEFRHIIDARREAKRAAAEAEGGRMGLSERIRRMSQSYKTGDDDVKLRRAALQRMAGEEGGGRWKFWKGFGGNSQGSDDGTGKTSDTSPPESAHEKQTKDKDMSSPPATIRSNSGHKKRFGGKLRTDMIKRVEGGGSGMVTAMGWYEAGGANVDSPVTAGGGFPVTGQNQEAGKSILDSSGGESGQTTVGRATGLTYEEPAPMVDSPKQLETDIPPERRRNSSSSPTRPFRLGSGARVPPLNLSDMEDPFPRSKTIAFNDPDDENRQAMRTNLETARDSQYAHALPSATGTGYMPRTGTLRAVGTGYGLERTATGRRSVGYRGAGLSQTYTNELDRTFTINTRNQRAITKDFGGFPTPFELGRRLFAFLFPKITDKFQRTMSIQRTATINSTRDGSQSGVKQVAYISFDAIVGRNSKFHELTDEQHDELGGVEYRALKSLFWIVLVYWLGTQFAGFIVIGPYISAGGRYNDVFEAQPRLVPTYWFAAFQSVSAYSNTGTSLADMSMLPFQTAYLMIVVLIALIYAGNTAFPIFLRFSIWSLSKVTPSRSRYHENLMFLLDHPRRCFIYLFPSNATWFLLFVMIALTSIDFVSFLVLDIGNPVIEAIPVGTRIASALMQSAAVRAAGFAIVPLSSLSPAVKVLYVIMMYISVYPVAMSVRATNVYEEKSLGVFEGGTVVDEDEPVEQGPQAVGKYLAWHAKRQLAFDIWWIGFALWLICIIERGAIDDTSAPWFDVFTILFEVVSAYGTIGLSLGLPYDNYSLCGGFKTLSKLVIIVVMLRGRHRGLPVAIDRAVMLPKDFTAVEEEAFERERSIRRTTTRGGSLGASSVRERSSTMVHGRRPSQTGSIPRSPRSPAATFDQADGIDSASHRKGSISSLPPGRINSPGLWETPYEGGALTPVREGTISRVMTAEPGSYVSERDEREEQGHGEGEEMGPIKDQ